MGEVLSFGFNLAVSFPSDSRGSKARIILLPSRIKRWCQILGAARPLRFKHWGARGDLSPTDLRLILSCELRWENDEQHRGHGVYTGSGHRCGVIPYSSVWCGGLPLGLMMNSIKEK